MDFYITHTSYKEGYDPNKDFEDDYSLLKNRILTIHNVKIFDFSDEIFMNKLDVFVSNLEDKYSVLDGSGLGEPLEEFGYDACDIEDNKTGDIVINEFLKFLVENKMVNPNEKIYETLEDFD